MPKCDSCNKSLKDDSSLLRHLSQKIDCKEHYGQESYENMKREARLSSKKKWNDKQSTKDAQIKRSRLEKEKRNKSARQRSQSHKSRKNSDAGKAFLKFHNLNYAIVKTDLIHSKEFTERAYDIFYDKAYNDAIDYAFGRITALGFINEEIANESNVCDMIEAALEQCFDEKFDAYINYLIDNFIEKLDENIDLACERQSELKSFDQFFEEFQLTLWPKLVDICLDKTFETLEKEAENISILKFQCGYLELTFQDKLSEEIKEVSGDTDLSTSISNFIKPMMSDKARNYIKTYEK